MQIHHLLLGVVGILTFLLLWNYWNDVLITRNEAEYRDIVEYQTMMAAAMIHQDPELIGKLSNIRYFPDQSGFFVVLSIDGKILSHGDFSGDLNGPIPFNIPVPTMIDLAKNGGGYVKYNYKGFIYDSFAYNHPGSPYVVCSGLYNDLQHINDRYNTWKRIDRTLLKSNPPVSTKKSKKK